MHGRAVRREDPAELVVGGLVRAVHRRRGGQCAAGVDRDRAALQRVDQGERLVGAIPGRRRVALVGQQEGVHRARAGDGVVEAGRPADGEGAGAGVPGPVPASPFRVGPGDRAAQSLRQRSLGRPAVGGPVEEAHGLRGLVQQPRHDADGGEPFRPVRRLGGQPREYGDEFGPDREGIRHGPHPGARDRGRGVVGKAGQDVADAAALGVGSGVEADHGGVGEQVERGGGAGGRQCLGRVGQPGEDRGVALGQDRQPAGLHGGGGQQSGVVGAGADRGGQFLDPGQVTGEHGRRGGLDQQPGAVRAVRCEVRGALEGRGRRRVAAAAAGPGGGPRQLRRDLRVGSRAGGRQVPGASVRFVPQQLGERAVGRAPGVRGRGVVHGGPDQRVAEAEVAAGAPDQPGPLGRGPDVVLGGRRSGRDGERRIGGVHGGREGNRPVGAVHGGREDNRPVGALHGGRDGERPVGALHGGRDGERPVAALHSGRHGARPVAALHSGRHGARPVAALHGGRDGERPVGVPHGSRHGERPVGAVHGDSDRRVGAVHRGQEQQGPCRVGGEAVEPGGEEPFQVLGQGQRARGRHFGGRPCEFHQCQGVAARLVQDACPGAAGGPPWLLVQQPVRRGVVERLEHQRGPVPVESGDAVAVAGRDQQGDRFAVQPSGGEGQCLQGGAVAPLGVVQHQQDGPPVAQGRQQAQHGDPDQQRIGVARPRRRSGTEGVLDGGALPVREPVQLRPQRTQQLVQRGVRQAGLRLAALGPQYAHTAGLGPAHHPVQQGALAQARRADERHHAVGGRRSHRAEQVCQFGVAADERLVRLRRRTGAACVLVHGVSTHPGSRTGAVSPCPGQGTSGRSPGPGRGRAGAVT
ncbi:hypothetical protein SFUMM280S_09142 [Streptomyces fumanus]